MDKRSLNDVAAKLQAELNAALHADPKTRESLNDIVGDVNRLAGKADDPSYSHASLSERLEKVAIQFEADHPTLAVSARQLIDLLSEVGI